MPTYRLVVFDLDGTLIDSLGDLCVAVNRLVARYGGREMSPGEVARMVGEGASVLVGRALAAAGATADPAKALTEFLEIYDGLLPGETRPYPGIPEALQALGARASLAVLTNKPTEATRKILDVLGLASCFVGIIGGDGPFRRKPHPDGLQHLVSLAGASPGETLLVGDSTVDVQTAHNAGTDVCVARYGFGQATFEPAALRGGELFVDRPDQLAEVIGARIRA